MFDLLSRLVPVEAAGPVIVAGAVWAGAHFVVIAPEIGERLAEKDYIPACTVDVAALQTRRAAEVETLRAKVTAERERIIAKARAAVEASLAESRRAQAGLDLLLDSPLGAFLDGLDPSGNMTGSLRGMIPQVPEIDLDALDLPTLPEAAAPPDPETQEGYCRCVVAQALEDTRFERTAHTASLTFYRPQSVTRFDETVAGLVQGGACGGL